MTIRRSILGFSSVAIVALVAAFVGVFFIPRNYCNELPTPTAEIDTAVGAFAAAGAAVLGMAVVSFAGSWRAILAAFGVGCVTVAAAIGVWALALHRAAGWSCG